MDESSQYHDLTKPARLKIYKGGRGGAKSWAAAEALVRKAKVDPLRILCTRETQASIEDSVHHLLVKTINRLGVRASFIITKTSIRSRMGAEFRFRGLRDNTAENIKSFEDADIVWVEEARSVSKQSWKFLTPTVRKPGSEIWITYNPEEEKDPVHELFVKNPPRDVKVVIHHVNFDSNPYFTKELEGERQMDLQRISDATSEKERAQAQSDYDHTWLGLFKKINDAVVLSGKIVEQAFPEDLWKSAPRLHYGADFGFANDPNTLNRFFIIDNVLYVEYEAHGVNVELEEMQQFYNSIPEASRWPIKADSARPETISYLSRQGFRISAAAKWSGSVEDGIAHLRGFKKIVIHPRCKHTLQEAKDWAYKRDPKTGDVLPVLIDKNNHHWDGIRYGLDGIIQKRGALSTWAKLAA